MLTITLPPQVIQAIRALEWSGFEAYLVGGGLRDSLLGLRVDDYDLATSASPEEMKQVFAGYRIYEIGVAHGTLQIIVDGLPMEITTYRTDGVYHDHRHPSEVHFSTSLEEDLARRDFTINAMAYHPERGLIDHYGGLADLRRHRLRSVGNPHSRFDEDALRILRALRLAARLGFTIEKSTGEALFSCSELLKEIAAERILRELLGLLKGDAVERIVQPYLGVLFSVLPELEGEEAEPLAKAISSVDNTPHLRLSALLSPIPLADLKALLRRLRVDRRTSAKVMEVLTGRLDPLPADVRGARRYSGRYKEVLDDILALKDATEQEDTKPFRELLGGIRLREDPLTLEELAIDGEDLLQSGVENGPLVGEILQSLLEFVYEDPMNNTRAQLLARAMEICQER